MKLQITNETKEKIISFDFQGVKDEILGKEYDLHLIFTDAKKMQHLNTIYRNLEQPTDILSFPYSENQGEIYMCVEEAVKEAPKFDRKLENFIAFLFIHGCVHLKGHDHGSTMERIEVSARENFGV